MVTNELQEVLDLLSNGPSSFAALYGFVVRGGASADVRKVWDEVLDHERKGMLRLYRLDFDGTVSVLSASDRDAALRDYDELLSPMGSTVPIEAVSVDPVCCWLSMPGGRSVGSGGAA